jgi:UDPglucose 6-dehydrogenase
MKICVIGSGYVGLVAGAGFAEIGHEVRCVDISKSKIDALNNGQIPIYEPGLLELCQSNMKAGRLFFSTRVDQGIKFAEIVVIAVGTPEKSDGSADLSAVLKVAETIAENIESYTVVACKSTVPVGTNAKIKETMAAITNVSFSVVSNPEFLREGEAINDFMNPPRVVIGATDKRAEELMRNLYAPLYGYYDAQKSIICMDPKSAEMTKYTANAFLATRITFINEIANLCEKIGADVNSVRIGAGTDPRIGMQFFYPGCGFGGSCFPKDVQALLRTSSEFDFDMKVLRAVDETNDRQKLVPFNKIKSYFKDNLSDKKIAVWGLAFKPETDDIRESPAIYIVKALLKEGATVVAHDPIAIDNFKRLVTDEPFFTKDKYSALDNADALIVVTDWNVYKDVDFNQLESRMKALVIVDGRNIWAQRQMPEKFIYAGIGRGNLSREK